MERGDLSNDRTRTYLASDSSSSDRDLYRGDFTSPPVHAGSEGAHRGDSRFACDARPSIAGSVRVKDEPTSEETVDTTLHIVYLPVGMVRVTNAALVEAERIRSDILAVGRGVVPNLVLFDLNDYLEEAYGLHKAAPPRPITMARHGYPTSRTFVRATGGRRVSRYVACVKLHYRTPNYHVCVEFSCLTMYSYITIHAGDLVKKKAAEVRNARLINDGAN
jgi:hypothetical protein